jgi:hypothetical protein
VVIGEVPVIPTLIGAAAGALLLNGLLWSMDFFSRPQIEEDATLGEGNVPPDAAAASAGEGESQGGGSAHLGD